MNPETQRKKLVTFGQDPQLAIFDELQELNTNIQGLSQFVEGATNVLVDKVRTQDDADRILMGLANIQNSFERLASTGFKVTQLDVKGVEKALKEIAKKDNTKELKAINNSLEELIDLEKGNEKVSVTVKIV